MYSLSQFSIWRRIIFIIYVLNNHLLDKPIKILKQYIHQAVYVMIPSKTQDEINKINHIENKIKYKQ